MNLLLDTHTLVWALIAPQRLPDQVRALIADRDNTLLVSAVSAFEIATKARLGKFPEATPLIQGYSDHVTRLGTTPLPISDRHALHAGNLSWPHRDPFDRLLAAQSAVEQAPLVTADAVFDTLAGVNTIWG